MGQTATNSDAGFLPRPSIHMCLGAEGNSDSVSITLHNFGSDTLSSVYLAWYQDSSLVGYNQWMGSLNTGESTLLKLGTFSFTHAGTTRLMFVSSSPNNKIDSDISNDTLMVDVHIGAGFSLPLLPDQSFCSGSSVSTAAQTGYSEYQWSTGDTSPGITVFSPGNYNVLVTDTFGCTFRDTVSFTHYPAPGFIVDTVYQYCANDNPEIAIDSSFSAVRWSSGDSGNVFFPSADGYYEVTVTDGYGCDHKSLVSVESLEIPLSGLVDSMSYCANENLLLNAQGTEIDSYLWSTGDQSAGTLISTPGVYTVELTHINGCVVVDSVVVAENALPQVLITGDTVLCSNDTVLLTAQTGASLIWSTGSSDTVIQVVKPGIYEVFVEDVNGCMNADQIEIIEEIISLDLGTDTIICDGDAILLDAGDSYMSQISWSDGSSEKELQIVQGGKYWVQASGQFCTETDTINVKQRYAPLSDFNFNVANNTVEFFNSSTDAVSYLWSFGDGNSSQLSDPIHHYTNAGTYPVTLTAYNVCGLSKQTDTIFVNSLGIGELGYEGKVNVYPNPATEVIFVSFEDWSGEVEISLMDALGRTIDQRQVLVMDRHQSLFTVNTLPKGMYFVSLVTSQKEVITKPIIVH
jgi:hypothetical protein